MEYWRGIIADESKLVINRDEMTSIVLFIIAKTEIPDLTSQLKLISEFSSYEIQQGKEAISNAFISLKSPVDWISSIDGMKLVDRSYLLRATIEMRDYEVRYDNISIRDGSDKYDPFSIGNNYTLKNTYIGGTSRMFESNSS